jgi:CHASE2 domain-containing sensor protein
MHHGLLYRPWLMGISLSTLVFMAYHHGFPDGLELRTLDVRFSVGGPLPPQLPIVIVSIDQDSFDERCSSAPSLQHRRTHRPSQLSHSHLPLVYYRPRLNKNY